MRTPISLRALVLFTCLPAAAALATDQAGVSAAVRGEVTLARAQAVGRAVVSGEGIFMQDKVRSGDRSGMQILLLDETTFTIGPDSEIEVDEFVYDPATGAGRLAAHIAKGTFRFVSGKIAKEQPSNMNVALPSGNIGIRGTMVAGMANSVTRASLVVLLGEGPDNASGDPAGSIDVCNAGSCTHVERPGFGVRIDGVEAPPSPAFRVADDAVDSILQAVTGGGAGFDRATADVRDEGVDPDLAPREDRREDQRDAREQRRRLARLDRVDVATDLASQDGLYQENRLLLNDQLMFPNGPSTFEQMRSIPQGQIHYAQSGVPLAGGSYDFSINVDFGAQTYGGGQSMFQVNGSRSGTQFITSTSSYGSSSGQAQLLFSSSAITGSGCGTNCTAQLALFPQNSGGMVAARALNSMTIKDFSGVQIDQGSGNASAYPGASP